jgi:predicted nucleotidyltransferase
MANLADLAGRQLSDVLRGRAAARLRRFRAEVERQFPGRVAEVVLFGSRARGDARRDSDYDLAVFIQDLDDRGSANDALADLSFPYTISGFHIRALAFPAGYLGESHSGMLAENIARDGIAVS